LGGYAIAADLIKLGTFDPVFDTTVFRPWLMAARTAEAQSGGPSGSVVSGQEKRPNNFGTHGSASRIAADLYLNDEEDLQRAIEVYKGWLGDRSSYAGFTYGELCYQSTPNTPVGINPKGAILVIDGVQRNADGILPDDLRRSGCPAEYPWPKENYVWGALQGAVVAAELLQNAGYPAFEWEDQALLRALTWLHEEADYPAEGDDRWIPWIINYRYNSTFESSVPSTPSAASNVSVGKNMGFADWTHQKARD
jgi:hypothetical protein